VAEAGGLHDFEVLLILRGGAGGYFVEPFAGYGFFEWAPAGEGGEELVVAAPAAKGNVAAHGEGVDELVVEGLIVERVGGGDERLLAGGGLEFEGVGIDAEALLCSLGEEGFGVDGAGEMHVEIGALGEGFEEGVELGCAGFFGVLKGALCAGFRRRLRGERGGEEGCDDKCGKCLANEGHAACLSAWLWVTKLSKDNSKRGGAGVSLAREAVVGILRVDVLDDRAHPR